MSDLARERFERRHKPLYSYPVMWGGAAVAIAFWWAGNDVLSAAFLIGGIFTAAIQKIEERLDALENDLYR